MPYYGAVRNNNTVKPRMTDWIQEIPTPRMVAKSTMGQSVPSIHISEDPKPAKRRRISLASTVIESEEGETDEFMTMRGTSAENKQVGEGDDGDDEYDEANAVMEDEDVTDQDEDTQPELLKVYPVQQRSLKKARPSPARRWSSRPGRFAQKGKKARSRSPSSEKEKEGQLRRGVHRSENGSEHGQGFEREVLVEKLRSLERLVEDIRSVLGVDTPASASTNPE